MPIVVNKRRKLIDRIFRIKLGEMNESACRVILIYLACAVDQIVEAGKLTVGGVSIFVTC